MDHMIWEFILHSSLIAGAAAAVLVLAQIRSAASEHKLRMGVLAIMPVLPLWMLWWPKPRCPCCPPTRRLPRALPRPFVRARRFQNCRRRRYRGLW
jgi:hypothetical protein